MMTATLDLNILQVCRMNGKDTDEAPGLYAVTPPRHPARGRDADHLIFYLSLSGNAPLNADQTNQLLTSLSQTFYKTPGSLTAAMRAVGEEINHFLLERNTRLNNAGRQAVGLLIQAVLRGDAITIGQCGPVFTYLLTAQDMQIPLDVTNSSRGLGLGKSVEVRYSQAKLNPGDVLIFASQPSPSWTESTLKLSPRQGLESLRRKLLENTPAELNAVLIQSQAGSGKLRLMRRKAGVPDMAHPPEGTSPVKAASPASTSPTPSENEPAVAPAQTTLPPVEISPAEIPSAAPETVTSESVYAEPPAPFKPAGAKPAPAEQPPAKRVKKSPAVPASPPKEHGKTIRLGLAAFLRALDNTAGAFGQGIKSLLKKLLPDESTLNLSPAVMIFFALAIPLVIGTAGAVVYIQKGRAEQYQKYYDQAIIAGAEAEAKTDPVSLRTAWQTALEYLDKAEFYRETDDSHALRSKANGVLDGLDAVERLDFQPAIIGGLDETVQISKMAASPTDLYLLNAANGSVLRTVLTSNGFEIDSEFVCGPTYGVVIVDKLIDIAVLPPGVAGSATIMGMDANGNWLFCSPDEAPKAASVAPPNIGFKQPEGFTYDTNDVYVLDPKGNAVWIYWDRQSAEQPRLFFGDLIPPMQDVIDLAVNSDDLYLLHSDGHITLCTYSGLTNAPTRCEEPANYSDTRPGRGNGAVIPDALFKQITYTAPPDPSIYLLDPENQAIYHMSLRLALQRQYRPLSSLGDHPATAFAVSPNHLAFIALGNQVYYAVLP